MTDLHCHILPGIDDGAKDVSVSLELLHKEYEDGVRNIAFTSHFNSERTTVEAFLEKRAAAYARLTEALKEEPMDFRFKLGSEVYFSPKLCELDAKALCMGDTAYMLIEFPTTHKPHFIKQTLYALQEQGILPLIAHIERYPYVLDDPTLLYEWVAAGAYAQINAGALLQDAKLRKNEEASRDRLERAVRTPEHQIARRRAEIGADRRKRKRQRSRQRQCGGHVPSEQADARQQKTPGKRRAALRRQLQHRARGEPHG